MFLGLIVLVIMFKYRKAVDVAIPLITIASKSTLKNIMLVALSLFLLCLQIAVIFIEIFVILKIYSIGEEQRDVKDRSPFVTYKGTA